MNYLRGAVNAISAPYQYYRDLPPINPSTLTGAIDVIVVQRPTDTGETELVCSPFHVRFGKWQVLRPGEKMVNVSVNGNPIPFKMKIGEAGEAFFVFEIEGDVPDELITSPILQPTRPEDSVPKVEGPDQDEAEQSAKPSDKVHENLSLAEEQEPDFLDLNALPSPPAEHVPSQTPKPSFAQASLVPRPASSEKPAQFLPSPPSTPNHRPTPLSTEAEQDTLVDQALHLFQYDPDLHTPRVEYHHEIALDAEGYHAHVRDRSDRTVRSSDNEPIPSGTDTNLVMTSSSPRTSPHGHPLLRAASEPPSVIEHIAHPATSRGPQSSADELSPIQEYSWEWGAFPQPSPVKAVFGKLGRKDGALSSRAWKGKGKEKLSVNLAGLVDSEEHLENEEVGAGLDHYRSRSVPPELEGSPTRDRKGKALPAEDGDYYDERRSLRISMAEMQKEEDWLRQELVALGAEGKLGPSKTDPTRFVLQIDERRVAFEVSVVEGEGVADGEDVLSIFDGRDEVEAARVFSRGKVDFERLLDEKDIINSPSLVIRWADNRYITRADGSPLMDALQSWREVALGERAARLPIRPTSPLSEDEDDSPPVDEEERSHHRAKSEPPEKPVKSSSLSWVRWWTIRRTSRSRREADLEKGEKQNDEEALSAREIPSAESAPAYPSTPVQHPTTLIPPVPTHADSLTTRKFAKTLRLTSDQLKELNLKTGTNTITFSLTASGVIACTARIFMWDSTDHVVISDIDGTITKSDGLGHVFAMIGRDWTHLGVAKLYTDITRNGYKIMYLTSRAIGQADATRDYLKGIKQSDYRLPEGPVIMSPDRLMASLHREVIMRKPEVFKMACLRDIQRLFGEASRNPFYAGFGNRITDALSYRSVNVPSAKIFTIDSSGEVKMELLELAGYKSSYIHMTDLVDQMFPPIHRKWAPEYTDFNYWKQPLQEFPLPDLSPPSPALSARSDTSGTLARLRNFSLVSSRQGSVRASSPPIDKKAEQDRQESQLRQMSSFERLRDSLGFSGNRSASPSQSSEAYDSDDEDGEGDVEDNGPRQRRERRRSMTSMPGTLDEAHFDMYEEDEYEAGEGEYENEDVDGGDEAFDEDLLAEMKDIPFL